MKGKEFILLTYNKYILDSHKFHEERKIKIEIVEESDAENFSISASRLS